MNLNWALLLDILMIVLMAGTIVYAFVLHKSLVQLRASKAEFEVLVQQLIRAMTQAETGMRDMKLGAQEIGNQLEEQVAHARGLSQELQFMLESGDSLANRLSRASEQPNAPAEAPKQPAGLFANKKIEAPAKPKSRAEAQLMEDLSRVAEARAAAKEA